MKRRACACVFIAASFFVGCYIVGVSARAQNGAGEVSVPGFGKANAKPLPPGGPLPASPMAIRTFWVSGSRQDGTRRSDGRGRSRAASVRS